MVLLIVTSAAKAAIDKYCQTQEQGIEDSKGDLDELSATSIGNVIEHHKLVNISRRLIQHAKKSGDPEREWRLDNLLKGASIYRPPPPPKPEATPQFKALMQRLREEDEQRQYERMLAPPTQKETFDHRFGTAAPAEIDEVTYADVNRQMVLIINVLVSIICTSVAVWMAARRWNVPSRMALSFSSSTLVAVAEVAIYFGYIRRIKDAKDKEKKQAEKKEILDTWVIDAKSSQTATAHDSMRFRKGKNR